MKKILKISGGLLLTIIFLGIGVYGTKMFLYTKTNSWYLLTFHDKTVDEQKLFVEKNNLKIIEMNEEYLIIKSNNYRQLLSYKEIEEVCQFSFIEKDSAKQDLSSTLNDQICNVERNEYMKQHPYVTSFMKRF